MLESISRYLHALITNNDPHSPVPNPHSKSGFVANPPILIMEMNKSLLFMPVTLIFLVFAAAGNLVSQDLPTRQIEDDSPLRISLENSWFRETPGNVMVKKPEIHTLRGGSRIQVRVEPSGQNRDEFAIVLAREQNGVYSGWAQGSWVLIRRRDNNPEGSRIRIFPRSDYNTYIQFRPFNSEKCLLDVVLYDAYLIRSLPVPIPFERLYTLPVEAALETAGNRFPRRYFDPEPGLYRDTRSFIAEVRSRLPELTYMDDGAIDENCSYVFIDSLKAQDSESGTKTGLNCSGFAKWIVDGILKPHTGERLPIAPLKKPFERRESSLDERWEPRLDTYFGLDWCRNLASLSGAALRSPSFGTLDEIEVRNWPFSQVIARRSGSSAVNSYPGFLTNAGFGFEGLHPLLYTLAVDEPNRIYLAAVNNEIAAPVTPDNPRGLPVLRRYYHIAVLVPYFNERGSFQVAVFESAAETNFNRFKTRYPGQYVNLMRVPVDGKFEE